MVKKYKNKKNKKITTKKYRAKKAVVRQPFVEQKYKETPNTAGGLAPSFTLNSGFVVQIPDSFEFMEQGDASNQISGRWIYSKWLTTKMILDYTPCLEQPIPMSFIMRTGWCKLNLNPQLPTSNIPIGPLSKTALQDHVAHVLSSAYEDPLGTGDARRLVITQEKFIHSNPKTIVKPDGHSEVFRSNKKLQCKWTVQRKIRYNKCFETGPVPYMQCNTGNWVPFISFQRAPTDPVVLTAYPKVHYKHRHYFTDS